MSSLLFQNNNLGISYDRNKHYLLLKWNGFVKSGDFRDLADEIIKAIEKTKTALILSDNTDWKIISPNDHGWAASNWFPRAEAHGVRKLATVLSNDYFNRLAERSIEGMADVNCMEIKNFNTADEALTWLLAKKPVADCDAKG